MKKSAGVPDIEFVPTEDIIRSVTVKKGKRIIVGFAAETENVVKNAREKLKDKGLDLIVANMVDSPETGFGTETDLAAVIGSGKEKVELRMMSKVELSDLVLDRIVEMLK